MTTHIFSSKWISASAGTGKTKSLVDRVISLLLSGVSVKKILCLTYTKAASNEMIQRISKELASFVKLDEEILKFKIKELISKDPNGEQIKLARNLFALTLDELSNLKIQTIHSFCQNILQNFSLEASLPPNFNIIDEAALNMFFKKAKAKIINRNESVKFLSFNLAFETFDKIMEEIIEKAHLIDISQEFSIENIQNEAEIEQEFLAALPDLSLITKETDFKLAESFISPTLNSITKAVLTKDLEPRKKLVTNEFKHLEKIMLKIQDLALEYVDKIKTSKLLTFSYHVYNLAKDLITEYESLKTITRSLDYNDIIRIASELLQNSEMREWILYKLDSSFDHILVDEAQDTSQKQWEIILKLSEEFFAGSSYKSNINRTIFCVGDEKQSIFSFQGADPNIFEYIYTHFESSHQSAGKEFIKTSLQKSYRSSRTIIDFVNYIVANQKVKVSISALNNDLTHFCHNLDNIGNVTVFKQLNDEDQTATSIASFIKKKIEEGTALPADFLILFRTRGKLLHKVIKEIKAFNIPVSGLDRLVLKEDITIQDLIAIGNFALFPQDDYNLALVLKSPLFNFSDQDLFEVCFNRESFLYEKLNLPYLKDILDISKLSAFDFYIKILDIDGYRENFLKTNGLDAGEIIDEFLYLMQDAESKNITNLQEFLDYFTFNNNEIKRDQDNNSDKVRIMTVHGSKGLEAPIVIIADSASVPNFNDKIILFKNYFLCAPKTEMQNNLFKTLKEEEFKKIYAEYLRLLYVAITRPKDELIIYGCSKQEINENSWYKIILSQIQDFAIETDDAFKLNEDIILKIKEQFDRVDTFFPPPHLRQKAKKEFSRQIITQAEIINI